MPHRTRALHQSPRPVLGAPLPGRHARTEMVRSHAVVALFGEIDLAAAAEVRAHLDAVTLPDGAQVVIDLRGAEFLDCAALALMCRARQRLHDRDGRLAVVCTRPTHLRLLRLTGLETVFRPVATLEAACVRPPPAAHVTAGTGVHAVAAGPPATVRREGPAAAQLRAAAGPRTVPPLGPPQRR